MGWQRNDSIASELETARTSAQLPKTRYSPVFLTVDSNLQVKRANRSSGDEHQNPCKWRRTKARTLFLSNSYQTPW